MPLRQSALTNAFVASIKAEQQPPLDTFAKILRGVGSEMAEGIIVGNRWSDGTPVDTGWARGNWFPVLGDDAASTNPSPPDPDGGAEALGVHAMAAVALAIATMKPGDVLSFVNNVAYIERLNNGWSMQAPGGMTDSIVAQFQQLVDYVAAKHGVTINGA